MSKVLVNNTIQEIYSTPERLAKERVVKTIKLGDGTFKEKDITPIWITNKYGVTTVVSTELYRGVYSNDPIKYRLATVSEVEAQSGVKKESKKSTDNPVKNEDGFSWQQIKDLARDKGLNLKHKSKDDLMKEIGLV